MRLSVNQPAYLKKLSLLADYADLRAQLRQDQLAQRNTLKQRDRRIGLDYPSDDDTNQIRRWLAALRSEGSENLQNGEEIDRLLRGTIGMLWLIGLIGGAGLARAVLHYDGREPVNLFSALLLLVGIQLLALIVLLVLSMIGGRSVFSTLSILNPAALVLKLVKRISSRRHAAIAPFLEPGTDPSARKVSFSLLIYLSQHFGLALNIGIVATLVFLVTISDLAFGWNTTLKVNIDNVVSGFQLLSWPWHNLVPAAVPDQALIEQSRFYRLAGQLRNAGWQVDKFGTWWLFVLMSVLVYGLLPRLVALVLAGLHYDRTLGHAIRSAPGASQTLARIRSPLVNTEAKSGQPEGPVSTSRPVPRTRQRGRTLIASLVNWSDAPLSESAVTVSGIDIQDRYDAGGHQTLEEDRDVIQRIARHGRDAVVIAIKSWEPPTLDFSDFVTTLREQLGPKTILLTLLIPVPGGSVGATELDTWETGLAALSDSALYVEPAT